jgi:hypothetical protein
MKKENRKILLLVDNATSHGTVVLSNVIVYFLPPHVTSEFQPLDQGIIRVVKAYYLMSDDVIVYCNSRGS